MGVVHHSLLESYKKPVFLCLFIFVFLFFLFYEAVVFVAVGIMRLVGEYEADSFI